MTPSQNISIDSAIVHYLNVAEDILGSRDLAGLGLAWSIFEESGYKTSPEWQLISSNLPASILDENSSVWRMLPSEEAEVLISNPMEVINTLCRYFAMTPSYWDNDIVACFMAKMANPKETERIYLPCAGLGKIMDFLPEFAHIVRSEEIDTIIWAMAKIRSHMLGLDNFCGALFNESPIASMDAQIKRNKELSQRRIELDLFNDKASSLDKESDSLYDVIIMSTSYYGHGKNAEDISIYTWKEAIGSAQKLLNPRGRIIVAIPTSLLHGAQSTSVLSQLIKTQSISRFVEIKSIAIGQPQEALDNSISILEITKSPSDMIALLDVKAINPAILNLSGCELERAAEKCLGADRGHNAGVCLIKFDEIKNPILSPSYFLAYYKISQEPHISLGECMSWIPTADNIGTERMPIVSDKNLSQNYLDSDIRIESLNSFYAGKIRYHRILNRSAILVNYSRGNRVLVGKLQLEEGQRVLLDNYILAFSVDEEKVNVDYLLKEITSEAFSELCRANKLFSDRRQLLYDFLNLIIPLPDLDSQYRILLDDARNSLSHQQAELLELDKKYITEIRLRKHTLISKFATFENNWKSLIKILQSTNGNINLKEEKDWLLKMGKSLEIISTQLSNLTQTQEDFGDNEPVDPDILIDSYCENNGSPSSNFKYRRDRCAAPNIKICLPRRAFDRIMENIVNNAVSHGFCDPKRTDYIISIKTFIENDHVCIDIANNGLPLSDKISQEGVFELGRSTSMYTNSHEGQGGFDIRKIMDMFGGEVSVISTPKSEFTVTYKLKFKKYETI